MVKTNQKSALNDREREIVESILRGEEHRDIAQRMHYSRSSVAMTISRLSDRFGAPNTPALIAALFRAGELT